MIIVAIEGIDGSGKTTLARSLAGRMIGGSTIVHGGEMTSALGEIIRTHLAELSALEKVYWFAADRCSVLESLRHTTDEGDIVIWDRYVDSARSYRGAEVALGLYPPQLLTVLERVNEGFPRAELTLFLDVTPALAAERRGISIDPRWSYVNEFFHLRCDENPDAFVRIDGSATLGSVIGIAEDELNARFSGHPIE